MNQAVQDALALLEREGILPRLCSAINKDDPLDFSSLSSYDDSSSFLFVDQQQRTNHHRLLNDELQVIDTAVLHFDWTSILMSVVCLVVAGICAGLILGIMSLDELHLHIKIRAGNDPDEQAHAEALLPLVQDRHLVLVSLLLMNFLADETLPLFLDNLLPTWAAVISSVFLVVFVSEIMPSAIFIGPDQLRLAAKVSPFCYFAIKIMYPIAFPIAKLLDWLLQDEDELGNVFNRGELAAMVRIQYESRMAAKRRFLEDRRRGREDDDVSLQSFESLHTAEVNAVEGILALKNVTAKEVCTKLRRTYLLPHDMVLDQQNVARIYGVGYSRVPVYVRNPRRPRDNTGIIGILITRQLILIDTTHKPLRKISSLPLYKPICVGPNAHLLQLVQALQVEKPQTAQMALVCERPKVAEAALEKHKPIPPEAGVIGILTLEDVMEELMQTRLYDETDLDERRAMERAEWAFNKWKRFTKQRVKAKQELGDGEGQPRSGSFSVDGSRNGIIIEVDDEFHQFDFHQHETERLLSAGKDNDYGGFGSV